VADAWDLTSEQVADIHEGYLTHLVTAAYADDLCTEDELRDLQRVCDLLGLERSRLSALMDAANASIAAAPGGEGRSHEFTGMSVCFTGACTCSVDGVRLTRDGAEMLAVSAGLVVTPRVTKQLDILVVADPDSMSGKAQKARSYGTRVIAERAFWPIIGVSVQ
jgi:DNA polymerase-3 subunit epsilon